MDSAKKTVRKISQAEKEVEKKVVEKLTVLWDDLPEWQRDNHYILSGYRPGSNSYKKSFASLCYLHNESVNIYSHLFGAVLALIGSVALYSVLGPRYASATREDVVVFSCFFLGAVACLGMSATYHTISNHSHEVAVWGNKLDYLGIVFLIWGSFIPVLYYGFQSEPQLMKTYAAMVMKQSDITLYNLNAPRTNVYTTDHHPGRRNLSGIHPPQIPHPRSPSLPGLDVRSHGSIGRLPRSARSASLRSATSPPKHRPRLGPSSRHPLHPRSGHLRSQVSRADKPGEVRYLGLEPPDLPLLSRGGGCGASRGLDQSV